VKSPPERRSGSPAEFNSIASPNPTAQSSTEVYGLGWARLSFLGHDVSESRLFYPVRGIILANRSFFTTEVHRGPVSTVVVAALEDGIGIVVLVNADAKGLSLEKIIVGVSEKVFGAGNSSNFPPADDSITSRSIYTTAPTFWCDGSVR
jgi:hypothetical protein